MESNRDKQRFINLGHFIIQSKYCYYFKPNYKHFDNDQEYDKLEDEYKELAIKLNLPPTASDMVGFDENKLSSKLAKEWVDSHKSVNFDLIKEE